MPCSWPFAYQQVLGLDVPVDDVEAVQVLDGTSQVVQHPTGIPFGVFVSGSNGIKKVSALRKKAAGRQHVNTWAMVLPAEKLKNHRKNEEWMQGLPAPWLSKDQRLYGDFSSHYERMAFPPKLRVRAL